MPDLTPQHIAVSRSSGIRIDWNDGHHSEYALRFLRDRCPCASCTEVHGPVSPPSPFAMYTPKLKLENVEPVGGYAVKIRWNDGHDTGIYTYDYLRRICPCSGCSPRNT